MVNYQDGKIYKILNLENPEMIYIGSTCQQLSRRITNHRANYKRWKNEKYNRVSVFDIFEKHGVENCEIILIELFPCNSKEELHKKEAEYIQSEKNKVNKSIPLRSHKQYYQDNKERYSEYREKNKELIRKKIPCNICGIEISKANMSRHKRTEYCIRSKIEIKDNTEIIIDNILSVSQ